MKIFTIDALNEITAWESGIDALKANGSVFGTLAEMDARFEENQVKPAEVWNTLAGVVPVKKFTNRGIGLNRIWKQIQSLTPVPAKPAMKPAKAKKAPKASDDTQATHTPRGGSKRAQVVEMLRTLAGATLEAIMEATGWQRHTVRGFIAGTARKRLGLKIESFKSDAGQRTYRVVVQGTPGPPGDPQLAQSETCYCRRKFTTGKISFWRGVRNSSVVLRLPFSPHE